MCIKYHYKFGVEGSTGMQKPRSASILFLAIVLVIAVVLGICGCSGGTEGQDVRSELNIRLWFSAAKQFDPAVCARASEYYILQNLFSNLVRFKPGGSEIVSDLAETWDVSPDGKTITFNLRKGVQFHKDYGEMTAEDVVFTFERLKNPQCEMSYLFETIIDKVEAIDDYTVELSLKKPYAPIFTYLAYRNAFIVSKKAVEEMGDDAFKTPIGTGPFVFQEMTADDKVIVTVNPDYYAGASKVTKITFHPIIEEEIAAMALQNGELDLIWTRGESTIAEMLEADPDITVKRAMTLSNKFVGFNPSFEPLSNAMVRQALAMAIDRDAIQEATGGLEISEKSIYNPLCFGYSEDVGAPDYDLEKAKKLLAEAGYPDGFKMKLTSSSASPSPVIAQVIQANWIALGLDVTLDVMEHGAFAQAGEQGEYEAYLFSLSRPPDPDLPLMEVFHGSAIGQGRANYGFYSGADKMIEAAAAEMDADKRIKMYRDIALKILEDMPAVPLTTTMIAGAWHSPVESYIPGINNEFDGYTIVLESK